MLPSFKRIAGPLALVALFVVGDVVPAAAQRTNADTRMRDRIEDMERDIRSLQRALDNEDRGVLQPVPAPTQDQSFTSEVRSSNLPATALLSERVDNLDSAVRGLTGEVEQMQFLINRLSNQLESLAADFDYRLRALEGNLAPGEGAPMANYGSSAPASGLTGGTGQRTMSVTPAPVARGDVDVGFQGAPLPGAGQPQSLGSVSASNLAGNEEADFEIGMQLLRQGDFVGAESTFQQFIGSYPDSDQMGEAYFWLGESLFVRELYSDAATSYLTSARDFGDSTKAPDSLLKLGMSLAALGQVDQACSAFNQEGRSYPDASSRVTRNVNRVQAENNC